MPSTEQHSRHLKVRQDELLRTFAILALNDVLIPTRLKTTLGSSAAILPGVFKEPAVTSRARESQLSKQARS